MLLNFFNKKKNDNFDLKYEYHNELTPKSGYSVQEFLNLSRTQFLTVIVTTLAFTCAIFIEEILEYFIGRFAKKGTFIRILFKGLMVLFLFFIIAILLTTVEIRNLEKGKKTTDIL